MNEVRTRTELCDPVKYQNKTHITEHEISKFRLL